jgi:FkbM family methyltransferase
MQNRSLSSNEEFSLTKHISVGGFYLVITGRVGDSYFDNIALQGDESFFLIAALNNINIGQRDIIDVGANIGLTATLLSKIKSYNRIFAIEPARLTFAALHENILLNGAENVSCYNIALGESPGYLPLAEDINNSSAAHLVCQGAEESSRPGYVEVRTLDHLCASENIDPAFIKIDVEGFESEVLFGSSDILSRKNSALYVELNSFTTIAYGRRNPLDVLNYIVGLDGVVFWRNKGEIRQIDKGDQAIEFLHHHLTQGSPVDDLLYIPPGVELNLTALKADLRDMVSPR